ncbi:MAG: ABC transporter permease subunit [Candidatus Lokiarchaeota archaeon]|nr:ABC transporter permease subunit [Candidatus Lokiarchaeota archaeon]MBD3199059.1 ABC transporter permease subunit [Candidatus Lokiarchaeota archaeon]
MMQKEESAAEKPKTKKTELSLTLKTERYFSKPKYRKILDGITISFFVLVIIGPIINIFSTILLNIPSISHDVFNDELIGALQWYNILESLSVSFTIASVAVIFDIIIALPISIILTRYNFRGKKFLDAIVDLPMAVPTSALGFSVLLFWRLFGINPGYTLIIFGHIVFTFPYIVRNMKIVLEKSSVLYEDAARTLGAPGITVFRTITLPMMKEGIIAGAILAFTRSLGETGATIILSGLVETAPILIVGFRRQLEIPSASFLAGILITVSILLLFSIKIFTRKVKFPVKRIWPETEKYLSKKPFRYFRDGFSLIVLLIVILIPSFFIITQITEGNLAEELFLAKDYKWAYLYTSFIDSISVGVLAVFINLIFGIPLAMIITKRNWGKFITILDTILDVPIAIPSAALGFAIFLFWGPAGLNFFQPGFYMILFVHISFTFPYMVRPIISVLEQSNEGVEEAARTLGASNITVFRKITLPNIKQGIIAGSIMVFTRSLGETGATIVVMGRVRTIPVLIVDWVEANVFASAIFASLLVILFSAFLIFLLRSIRKKGDVIVA